MSENKKLWKSFTRKRNNKKIIKKIHENWKSFFIILEWVFPGKCFWFIFSQFSVMLSRCLCKQQFGDKI